MRQLLTHPDEELLSDELGDDPAISAADTRLAVEDQEGEVDVGPRGPHDLVEPLAQECARLVVAGGVDEDHLRRRLVEYPSHRAARGLRLIRCDCDLAPD